MKKTEISYFKTFLVEQKTMILNCAHEFKKSEIIHSDQIADDAEAASSELNKNISLHLHERDRASLLQIERALAKIELGLYGQCEDCGQGIEPKRLKARPFAALCIECMEELESPKHILN